MNRKLTRADCETIVIRGYQGATGEQIARELEQRVSRQTVWRVLGSTPEQLKERYGYNISALHFVQCETCGSRVLRRRWRRNAAR